VNEAQYSRLNRTGLSLIGLIMAVVVLGLMAGGALMLISAGSSESMLALNRNRAFYAAESGLSAARIRMAADSSWQTSAPILFTGTVGQASFSALMESNLTVTSEGRWGDARWTSIWTGSLESATGQVVAAFTNGNVSGDLANFPGVYGDCAQSFTTPAYPVTASGVEIHFQRSRNGIASVFMTLRSGSTIGPVLATSQAITAGEMPSGNKPDWMMFTFSAPVELDASTMYFIRLSSVPDSTVPRNRAKGVIHWTYRHSAFSPPAYADGDAWRYIGMNNNPSYEGQQLGPVDQYDFNFRVYN
jgi:Tfp pilus assembly protein PilX